ncbi:MAG: ribosome small subunit-dependent GTPase A [Christensenellales bacterium]
MRGEIVEGRGGLYTVQDAEGSRYTLRARKKFRRDDISPLPGDRVQFTPRPGEEHGWLDVIEPRSSLCLRPPVANIQLTVIVASPEPAPDWLLVDKLLLLSRMQDIRAVLAINKCDLDRGCYEEALRTYRGAQMPVLAMSTVTGEGLDALRGLMRGSLCCLAGQSGVGKSALLSRVMDMALISGAISPRIQRGRQTTRHTSLLYKDGLRVLDTPGFSLLEAPGDLPPEDLPQYYPEFSAFGPCRFQPCLHLHEPDCLVREAERNGAIDPARMARYRQMMALVQAAWKERYD